VGIPHAQNGRWRRKSDFQYWKIKGSTLRQRLNGERYVQ